MTTQSILKIYLNGVIYTFHYQFDGHYIYYYIFTSLKLLLSKYSLEKIKYLFSLLEVPKTNKIINKFRKEVIWKEPNINSILEEGYLLQFDCSDLTDVEFILDLNFDDGSISFFKNKNILITHSIENINNMSVDEIPTFFTNRV